MLRDLFRLALFWTSQRVQVSVQLMQSLLWMILPRLVLSGSLAVGTVNDVGYKWRPERDEYNHTVGIDWDTSGARLINPVKAWATTTVSKVPGTLYRQIFGRFRLFRGFEACDGVIHGMIRACVIPSCTSTCWAWLHRGRSGRWSCLCRADGSTCGSSIQDVPGSLARSATGSCRCMTTPKSGPGGIWIAAPSSPTCMPIRRGWTAPSTGCARSDCRGPSHIPGSPCCLSGWLSTCSRSATCSARPACCG